MRRSAVEEELILKIIREKLKVEYIPAEILCNGLCSMDTFNKYCSCEIEIDYLTLEVMLERLGLDSMDFISWVDYDAYEYLSWRNRVLEEISNKNIVMLRQLLYSAGVCDNEDGYQIPTTLNFKCCMNPRLIMQFIIMAVSVLEWYEGKIDNSVFHAKSAADYIYGIREDDFDNISIGLKLLSDSEIALYVLSDYFEVQNNLHREETLEKVCNHLRTILRYIDGNGRDVRSVSRMFPYVSYIYTDVLIMLGRPELGIATCKRAIELMRMNNQCRMLKVSLEQYIQLMDELEIKKRAKEEQELLKGWNEVLELAQEWMENDGDELETFVEKLFKCGAWSIGTYGMSDDIIKLYRARAGITQKRLSIDTDYSMRSMWMIENAKTHPQKNGYNRIRKRLRIPSGSTQSDIFGTSYKVYMLKYRLERAMMNGEIETEEKLINEMEKMLVHTGSEDCINSLSNRQFIMDCRNGVAYRRGQIDAKEYLESCKKCLAITVDISNIKIDKVFFRVEELMIILHVAQAYGGLKNNEKAVYYSKLVIDYCLLNKIKNQAYLNKMLIAYLNLVTYYGLMQEHDKAIQYAKKGLLLDIKSGKGKLAPSFIHGYAYSQTMLGNRLKALKCFEIVIHSSKVFGNSNYEKAVKNYAWVKEKIESENT